MYRIHKAFGDANLKSTKAIFFASVLLTSRTVRIARLCSRRRARTCPRTLTRTLWTDVAVRVTVEADGLKSSGTYGNHDDDDQGEDISKATFVSPSSSCRAAAMTDTK